MRNFYRALQRTFKYRLQITAALLCALLVGILWGGNIGAVTYPLAEICLPKLTFIQWIDQRLDENRTKIESLEKEIQSAEASQTAGSSQNSALLSKKLALEENIRWLQRTRPFALRCTPSDPFHTLVLLMGIVLIGTIVKIVFLVAHGILSAWIAQHSAMQIREEFFKKVLDYETGYFNQGGIADMMSRFTNDMEALTQGLNIVYGKVVREPLKMIICIGLAAWVSWQLLLITLLLVPVAGWSIRWLARSIKRVARRTMEEISNLYGRLEETFRSIRVVKAFTRENFERAKFRRINRAYCNKSVKIAKYESLANPMTELFGILMICVAVIIGAYFAFGERTALFGIPILAKPLDMGSLVLFFALLAGAADPARKLSDIFTQFQKAAAAADRIYALIDRKVPIHDPDTPVPMPRHRRSIRFENIRFEYERGRPILKDVSLEVRFGECIAILGASGCGKSTLLNMVPRFIDPGSGQVLVDDVPISRVRMRELRRQIGLVTQEPVLFNDTVLNNIRYGCSSASREEAIEAARKAFARDFIENELLDGYETIVGPGGGLLSGGQRQRIALARAILRDPPIFLLDEATSQIDLNSEKMIHEALKEFKKGRTTILITHRLTALDFVDRIVMMDEGRIVGAGTHQELLQSTPIYAKLFS